MLRPFRIEFGIALHQLIAKGNLKTASRTRQQSLEAGWNDPSQRNAHNSRTALGNRVFVERTQDDNEPENEDVNIPRNIQIKPEVPSLLEIKRSPAGLNDAIMSVCKTDACLPAPAW